MTTLTQGASHGATTRDATIRGAATLRDLAVAAALGLGIVWLAGFAGAQALHASAHDTRHSTGFPCH